MLGSFLASVLMVLALEKSALSPDLRLILVTGVLGGFTTYSSFNYETLHLAQSGAARAGGRQRRGDAGRLPAAPGIAGIWLARAVG